MIKKINFKSLYSAINIMEKYLFKTNDGIEFYTTKIFSPDYSFIEVENPLDHVFSKGKLNHEKLFQVLHELFPTESWSEYEPLKWRKTETGGTMDKKHGFSLILFHEEIVKYYQGIIHTGKFTLPKSLTKNDRRYINWRKGIPNITEEELEKTRENLKIGVDYVTCIYPQLLTQWYNRENDALLLSSKFTFDKGGYLATLNEILSPLNIELRLLSLTSKKLKITQFKPQEVYYSVSGGEFVSRAFHVHPALPSKINRFIKILQDVYDNDKLEKLNEKIVDLRSLKKSAERLKIPISKSRIKTVEEEIEGELIKLRKIAGIIID